MKQKKVILELYMEIWYCYQDGKSMAYPLFTTTTYEDADNICKKRNYDVIQVIDLELQDFDDTPDHKTWWKGLNEEEQTKLCQKHFQGIPVESLMERSIKVMYHYENPETTTNTVTGEIIKAHNSNMLLAMEFGYRECEKGNNLDMAFINFNKALNNK